jgi:hypothetical protein
MSDGGIVVECVACKGKKTITFDEASHLLEMPFCERCYMPMVAVEATVNNTRKKQQ